MPYTIAWKPGVIIWTFHGTVSGKDAIQANLDIYGDPRFDNLRYGIVDLTEVEQFDIANEDLEAAAALDDAATITNSHLAIAVIATTDEARRVASLYESAMSTSKWKVKIFGTPNDAKEWLSLTLGIGADELDVEKILGRTK